MSGRGTNLTEILVDVREAVAHVRDDALYKSTFTTYLITCYLSEGVRRDSPGIVHPRSEIIIVCPMLCMDRI